MKLQNTMHKLESGQFVWGNIFKDTSESVSISLGSYIGLFTEKNSIALLQWEIRFFPAQKIFPVEFLRKSLSYVFELTNYHFVEGYPEVAPVLSPFLKTYEYFPKIKNPKKFIQSLARKSFIRNIKKESDDIYNNKYKFLIRI